MRKGDVNRLQHSLRTQWSSITLIPWARYGCATGLAILVLLAIGSRLPAQSPAVASTLETHTLPSPTLVQVTPPPKGTAVNLPPPASEDKIEPIAAIMRWVQDQGWLLPFAGGILIWTTGGGILLVLLVALFLYARHRRRPYPSPPITSSIPFLKSSDGSLYFRLDRLEGDGLIIGRGKQDVDLIIEESIPYGSTVSERHARVYYDQNYDNVIIEDLGSANGVFINSRRAPRKNLLKDGWVVSLGSVVLTYYDGESDTGPLN